MFAGTKHDFERKCLNKMETFVKNKHVSLNCYWKQFSALFIPSGEKYIRQKKEIFFFFLSPYFLHYVSNHK